MIVGNHHKAIHSITTTKKHFHLASKLQGIFDKTINENCQQRDQEK
jgi:hypothetical protein